MVTDQTVSFPMTLKEMQLFLNVIDHARGPAMRQVHKMTPVEIDTLKRRIRLTLSDQFGVEPRV